MSDEFAQWNNLAKLWHSERGSMSATDIEQHARRQRQDMLALAAAEAIGFALVMIGAVWISMHTAMIAMSALTIVFFAFCGFMQHRMRREPPHSGGDDLLSSLEVSIAREEWNLAQLGIGRAGTFLTFFAIVMVASNHLRFIDTTPAGRLWSLSAIALIVFAVLLWNLFLTRRTRIRKLRLESFAARLRDGAEFKTGKRP
jgi:FtsH-binding integral membrane protein